MESFYKAKTSVFAKPHYTRYSGLICDQPQRPLLIFDGIF